MKKTTSCLINVIPAKAGIHTNRSPIKSGMTIITLIIALFAAPTVHAREISLSLDPPIVEVVIKPGKNINQTFIVKNLAKDTIILTTRIVPFSPEDSLGNPTLKPNSQPEWLKYFTLGNTNLDFGTPFTLAGNASKEISLNINVPRNAALTDHYATLLVSSSIDNQNEKTQGSSALSAAIGSNILLSIVQTGNPPVIIKIEEFAPIEKDYLYRYGQYYFIDSLSSIRFTALAKNTSKYATKTSGLLKITSNDKTIHLQSLIANNLLANSNRVISGSPSGELVFKPSLSNIGQFQATIEIKSDNSSSQNSIYLVILPIKASVAAITALLLLTIISKLKPKRE